MNGLYCKRNLVKKNLEDVVYEIDQQGKLQANTILFSTSRKFLQMIAVQSAARNKKTSITQYLPHIINKVLEPD